MSSHLSRLAVSNIRNLIETEIGLCSNFNVFIGPNGSGKTSVLEAIHLLGLGRSFRVRSIQQMMAFGADKCLVRAKMSSNLDGLTEESWLALSRNVGGVVEYRIGDQGSGSPAEMSKLLPVQLIDSSSSLLLEGGPIFRRQFMDWGVFHVEHTFLDNWRLMRRALEQRNMALKRKQQPAVWDEAFVRYSQLVDEARDRYVQRFTAVAKEMLQSMMGISGFEFKYRRGWSDERDLAVELDLSLNNDWQSGYTTKGPQRADLDITLDGRSAKAVLSRGQTKVLVSIMLLARAKLLNLNRKCIFLIDDLHAELDKDSCNIFIKALNELDCQVFITGIDEDLLKERLYDCNTRMFHVERGVIAAHAE